MLSRCEIVRDLNKTFHFLRFVLIFIIVFYSAFQYLTSVFSYYAYVLFQKLFK